MGVQILERKKWYKFSYKYRWNYVKVTTHLWPVPHTHAEIGREIFDHSPSHKHTHVHLSRRNLWIVYLYLCVFVFVYICICVYFYLCIFVSVCICLHTLLSGDNSTSLTSAVFMASISLGGEKPDEKQTHRNPTPRHRTKKGFHSEILALVFAFFMKYEWRRFYYVWQREVWQKARPLKPNPCHGTKRGFTLNYWITRSLGDLRAPTSSWGPFRPIDFLAQAV